MATLNNSALSAGFDDYDDLVEEDDLPPIQPVVDSAGELTTSDPKETVTQPEDALAKSSRIPPKLVEDVQSNPELLRPVARSMAAVNLHNLFTKVQHPSTSTKDRLEFQTLLNRMSGLDAKEAAGPTGPGFSIVINIPQVGQTVGQVIEAKATAVEDAQVLETDE